MLEVHRIPLLLGLGACLLIVYTMALAIKMSRSILPQKIPISFFLTVLALFIVYLICCLTLLSYCWEVCSYAV